MQGMRFGIQSLPAIKEICQTQSNLTRFAGRFRRFIIKFLPLQSYSEGLNLKPVFGELLAVLLD